MPLHSTAARALFCVGLLGSSACKGGRSNAPVELATERASDASGEIEVEIAYVPRGEELELQVRMNALGTEEMDKIVLEFVLEGLILVEGGAQWAGFVPPRQPQRQNIVVKVLESAQREPVVDINISRSRDSLLLLQKTVSLEKVGGSLVPVSGG